MLRLVHLVRAISPSSDKGCLKEAVRLINKKAFTLAELLLTTAILVFALSTVLVGFVTTILLNRSSRNLTRATTHANYVTEEIRAYQFSSLVDDVNNGTWDWDATEIQAQGLRPLPYENIEVAAAGNSLVEISLTVNWRDHGSRSRNLNFRTLRAAD